MKNPDNVDSGSIEENSENQRVRLVVMFDEVPSSDDDKFIEECIHNCTSEWDDKCTHAKRIRGNSSHVELWEFEGTPTSIRTHSDRILSGVSSTKTHSENFEIDFQEQIAEEPKLNGFTFPAFSHNGNGEEPLLIAVLDTGVDTSVIPREFLWHDKESGQPGKSFIKNEGRIEDDDKYRHGTLVSSLILEQFRDFPDFPVQIMNLKTHNGDGKGDLFAIMDAICFARENGADIINASWGFYQDEEISDSLLKKLITESLLNQEILFITVSGNKIPGSGPYFFPATFGKGISDEQKNLIVVTSINDKMDKVNVNHNSSPEWVDFGVPADSIQKDDGKREYYIYNQLFQSKSDPELTHSISVSGTSFATAIATGRIATFGKDRKGNKKKIIDDIGSALFDANSSLEEAIIGGMYLKRN